MATVSPAPALPLPLLTKRDTATLLNVSLNTVSNMVTRGDLRAIKLGFSVRFRREDVLALMGEAS